MTRLVHYMVYFGGNMWKSWRSNLGVSKPEWRLSTKWIYSVGSKKRDWSQGSLEGESFMTWWIIRCRGRWLCLCFNMIVWVSRLLLLCCFSDSCIETKLCLPEKKERETVCSAKNKNKLEFWQFILFMLAAPWEKMGKSFILVAMHLKSRISISLRSNELENRCENSNKKKTGGVTFYNLYLLTWFLYALPSIICFHSLFKTPCCLIALSHFQLYTTDSGKFSFLFY